MTTTSPETISRVPLSLVLQQGPMLRALGRIVVQSLLPMRRPRQNPDVFQPVELTIAPPSAELVASYAAWCGAGPVGDTLPPHLLSQWALPAAVRVLEQTRYTLANIINQGVHMRINAALPAGQPLRVSARMKSLEEIDGRARCAVEISSGPAHRPDAVVATLHVVFVLSSSAKKQARQPEAAPHDWSTVGDWRAAADDGLRFALLTGDFNPIHWIDLFGRMSPFKHKVLHGFGMLARSYEVLAAAGPIEEIDLRLLKAVPLPSGTLRVQSTPADAHGWQAMRLIGERDQLHLTGRYRRTHG